MYSLEMVNSFFRRVHSLEGKVDEMKKELEQKRAEEEGLMAEMEATGTVRFLYARFYASTA